MRCQSGPFGGTFRLCSVTAGSVRSIHFIGVGPAKLLSRGVGFRTISPGVLLSAGGEGSSRESFSSEGPSG